MVQDSSLSWKARGIFIYLWSQANEWQFYVSEIAKHSTDGERALRSGLKELEEKGYLKRVHRQSNDGSFDGMDWILSDDPNINHHSQNAIDGEKAENEPKMLQNASDAKRIGCETHSMQKGGLININNNNYQYKKISKIINEKNHKRNKKETATDWSKKQPTYDPNVDLEQIFDDLDDRDEKNA